MEDGEFLLIYYVKVPVKDKIFHHLLAKMLAIRLIFRI